MELERMLVRPEAADLREKRSHLEEEHQVLLDHIPDAVVCVLDTDLRFVHINRVIDSLDWGVEDILGKTVDEVMLDRPEARASYRAALEGEQQTLDYTSLNGERDLSLQIVPLRRGSEIYGVMSIHQDVTERVEIERRLREETDELESAFRHAAIGMAVSDLAGRWLKANRSPASSSATPRQSSSISASRRSPTQATSRPISTAPPSCLPGTWTRSRSRSAISGRTARSSPCSCR